MHLGGELADFEYGLKCFVSVAYMIGISRNRVARVMAGSRSDGDSVLRSNLWLLVLLTSLLFYYSPESAP